MVPTKRLWGLVALGIPIAALCGAAGNMTPLWIYNALLLLVCYGSYRLAPTTSSLRIHRHFDSALSVRVPNRVVVEIENEGLESIVGVIRDEPPPRFQATRKEFGISLAPGELREFDYLVTPNERGGDFFRGTFFKQRCPLGLVEKIVRLRTEQPLRVYPNVLALREFDLLRQKGRLSQMGIRKSRIRGLGSEFESLREYGQGDDYRKIDWKATARRSKLVVRQYEQERNQAVVICLDIGRRMLSEIDGITKLDHALDSILLLAHAVVSSGDNVGLLVYADRVRRYIPPKKGRSQLATIIEAIHDLVAEPIESDPAGAYAYLSSRWKRRSLLIAFGDIEDRLQANEMIGAMSPVKRRHITLFARVADPRMKELVQAPVQAMTDMYSRSAALMLLSERKDASASFEAAGVHSLESEPQDLTAALVSFYFMVKERSLL